jgi:hypothetical protein
MQGVDRKRQQPKPFRGESVSVSCAQKYVGAGHLSKQNATGSLTANFDDRHIADAIRKSVYPDGPKKTATFTAKEIATRLQMNERAVYRRLEGEVGWSEAEAFALTALTMEKGGGPLLSLLQAHYDFDLNGSLDDEAAELFEDFGGGLQAARAGRIAEAEHLFDISGAVLTRTKMEARGL